MVVGRHLRHSHLGRVFAWTPTIEGEDAGEQWSSRTRRGTVRPGSRRFNCCMGRDAIQHANRVFRERHAQARRGHAYREGEEVLLSSEHLSLRGEHPKFLSGAPFCLGPSEEDVQPEASRRLVGGEDADEQGMEALSIKT